MKIEKRAMTDAGAFSWIVAWTFGKEYEQNHRLTAVWDTTQPLYFEPSNQDKTHSITFNGVYDLPFGRTAIRAAPRASTSSCSATGASTGS